VIDFDHEPLDYEIEHNANHDFDLGSHIHACKFNREFDQN
jgi:hypothetical protein